MYNSQNPKFHEILANQLIKKLEEGTAPWQLPWENGVDPVGMPYNAVTGNRYKGINSISLLLPNYDDPRWMTYRQAQAMGWQVRQGEKATTILFRKTSEFIPFLDAEGREIRDDLGKVKGHSVKLERPIVKTSWVFNARQISGIPELDYETAKITNWTPIKQAEHIINSMGANIKHEKGNNAFYNPLTDEITLPLTSQFSTPDRYYATALHEIAHWTGHASRLDRRIMNTVGSPEYAREELRAEIASLFLGHELGIGHDPGQHAAYVDAWVRTLRDTPSELLAATADAELIFDYVMDRNMRITKDLYYAMKDETILPLIPQPKLEDNYLTMGQSIHLENSHYIVTGMLKRGRVRLQEMNSGMELSISREDPFYLTLLQQIRNQELEQNNQKPSNNQFDHPTGDNDPDISR